MQVMFAAVIGLPLTSHRVRLQAVTLTLILAALLWQLSIVVVRCSGYTRLSQWSATHHRWTAFLNACHCLVGAGAGKAAGPAPNWHGDTTEEEVDSGGHSACQ